jgi:hypothetical protein
MTGAETGRIVGRVLQSHEQEARVMYLVVHHRVVDRAKFLATDPKDIGGGAPAGVEVCHFLPARDASAADCLWQAESLEVLRGYLDPATRGICENSYFEVDAQAAMGLPAA